MMLRPVFLLLTLLLLPVAGADAAVLFRQAPAPQGGLIPSAMVGGEGSDADQYAYDSFVLQTDQTVAEIAWRGGHLQGTGGVRDFVITIYGSIEGGSQPLVTGPDTESAPVHLARYTVGGNAGASAAGTAGGTPMYDYRFVLPVPFRAQAGKKYWLQIEAVQSGSPDWGIAAGTGGDGKHFQFIKGARRFTLSPADTAFSLLSAGPPR